MYQDSELNSYPRGSDPSTAPTQFYCGAQLMTMDTGVSSTDYFVFTSDLVGTGSPCISIVFNKAFDPTLNKVQARGYNRCAVSPRQVERALEVVY